jgi:hypothetical protein
VTETSNGRKALVLREEQVSQTVGGRPWARTVQTKAQWPGQKLVKIQNESHILTFQVRFSDIMMHASAFWQLTLARLTMDRLTHLMLGQLTRVRVTHAHLILFPGL